MQIALLIRKEEVIIELLYVRGNQLGSQSSVGNDRLETAYFIAASLVGAVEGNSIIPFEAGV